MTVSPLAPAAFPELAPVAGVTLHAYAAGLRYTGRPDLMLAVFDEGTAVGGVFTQSRCASSTVDWCRSILGGGSARAVVCNAGNANAFNGVAGDVSVHAEVDLLADALDVDAAQIFVASTGVIGEPLDDLAMAAALAELVQAPTDSWADAATAITTTDTFIKGAGASVPINSASSSTAVGGTAVGGTAVGGTAVEGTAVVGTVVGIAKGSGMIAPDMATMLGFVFTDVAVTSGACQTAIAEASDQSFNKITVDSDTSTSDTVLLFATGAIGNDPIDGPGHPDYPAFAAAVLDVCLDLSHQIVRDGEGATKFIEIRVEGAVSDTSAEIVARSIADSPLVKTAMAAEDANWGRIVMAVGKAGEPADRDRLDIFIGDEQVACAGQVHPNYSEDRANVFLKNDDIVVRVDLGMGDGSSSVWTCDLTHGYIEINAGYRS